MNKEKAIKIINENLKKEYAEKVIEKLYIAEENLNKKGEKTKSLARSSWQYLTKPSNNEKYSQYNQLSLCYTTPITQHTIITDDNVVSFVNNEVEIKTNEENKIATNFPLILENSNNKKLPNIINNYKKHIFLKLVPSKIVEGVRKKKDGSIFNSKLYISYLNNTIKTFHLYYSEYINNIFQSCLLTTPENQLIEKLNIINERIDMGENLYFDTNIQPNRFKESIAMSIVLVKHYPFLAMYLPIVLLDTKLFQNIINQNIDKINGTNGFDIFNKDIKTLEGEIKLKDYINQLSKKSKKAKLNLMKNLKSMDLDTLDNEKPFIEMINKFEEIIKEVEKRKVFIFKENKKTNVNKYITEYENENQKIESVENMFDNENELVFPF